VTEVQLRDALEFLKTLPLTKIERLQIVNHWPEEVVELHVVSEHKRTNARRKRACFSCMRRMPMLFLQERKNVEPI
jgi:hypothetical protein